MKEGMDTMDTKDKAARAAGGAAKETTDAAVFSREGVEIAPGIVVRPIPRRASLEWRVQLMERAGPLFEAAQRPVAGVKIEGEHPGAALLAAVDWKELEKLIKVMVIEFQDTIAELVALWLGAQALSKEDLLGQFVGGRMEEEAQKMQAVVDAELTEEELLEGMGACLRFAFPFQKLAAVRGMVSALARQAAATKTTS